MTAKPRDFRRKGQEMVQSAAPLPPRPSSQPPSPPPASGATPGKAMQLDFDTAYALADVAAIYGLTETEAAVYAIKLWHWIANQTRQGKILCMADGDRPEDEVRRIELPEPKTGQ